MRRIATIVAAALAAATVPVPAFAADYVGFAGPPRPAGYDDPLARPPAMEELVDYAVSTFESFPDVGGTVGEALFTSAVGRVGRPVVRDQGRYLYNFRIPPGATLTRARAKARDDAAADAPTMAVVPEPATWALMILGFGAVASALRRRRSLPAPA